MIAKSRIWVGVWWVDTHATPLPAKSSTAEQHRWRVKTSADQDKLQNVHGLRLIFNLESSDFEATYHPLKYPSKSSPTASIGRQVHQPRITPPPFLNTNIIMATNSSTGTNGAKNSKFDPNFTQHVIDLMSPETKPRHRQILSSLISHLHDFCRDVELTQDEWVLGVNYINSIGQAYKKNRNEAWRVCDILGIES